MWSGYQSDWITISRYIQLGFPQLASLLEIIGIADNKFFFVGAPAKIKEHKIQNSI